MSSEHTEEPEEPLRAGKSDTSTTNPYTQPRCPECKTFNICEKRDKEGKQPAKKPGDFKCHNCHHHFNEPAPPVVKVRDVAENPEEFRVPDGQELRDLRVVAGLTLEEAGERIGRSATAVSDWEIGDAEPRADDVRALLDVYVEEKMGGSE
jgi:ribosome-binding protein aMBF1 (putative translation factor)